MHAQRVTAPFLKWEMLTIGSVIYFMFGLISAAIAVMVNPIRAELNISYTQMGVILGSWQFVYIFVALPLGLIIDRLGLKSALLVGAVLISCSALLRAVAIDFWSLLAAVGLFGIGGPIVSIGLPKLVATWFPSGRRTLPTGIYVTGSALGAAVALAGTQPVFVPLLGGWREAYVAMGVVGMATVIWWWIRGQDLRTNQFEGPLSSEDTSAIRAVLGSPPVLVIACIGFAGFMLTHGLNNWLPQILEAKNYNPTQSGFLATLPRLGGILSGLIAAQLAFRLRGGTGAAVVVLVLSGFSLAILTFTGDTATLVLSLAVLGIASTAIMPLMTAMLMDVPGVGPERMGVAAGVYFTVGEVGGFGGPALLGWLLDITGSFVPGLLAMVGLSFVTLIPLWVLTRLPFRPTKRVLETIRR